jgi:hypothetical protein
VYNAELFCPRTLRLRLLVIEALVQFHKPALFGTSTCSVRGMSYPLIAELPLGSLERITLLQKFTTDHAGTGLSLFCNLGLGRYWPIVIVWCIAYL